VVTFTTTLLGEPGGSAGIHVPDEVIESLAAGRRPPVLVTVNGHTFASTVAVMGGQYLMGAALLKVRAAGCDLPLVGVSW
jgi:uncharacterized protein DUF1905